MSISGGITVIALYDSAAVTTNYHRERVEGVKKNKKKTHFQGNSLHVINSCSEIFKASFQLSVDGC